MKDIINKIKSSINVKEKPKNLRIFEFTKIINPEHVFVGDNVVIDDFCLLYAKPDAPIIIGSWVHIANFTSLTGGPITFGDFVGISSGTRVIAGTDHYANGSLMGPAIPDKYRNVKRDGCIIEDFCCVGANSCIFPGVTLGEGAIVGTSSIVRHDLEPWGIYIMKNGKMIKINTRNKEKTYETARKLSEEFKDIRLLNNLL